MPIAVGCPSCSFKADVHDDLAGRKVKCPECSSVIAVEEPVEIVQDDDAAAIQVAPRSEPAAPQHTLTPPDGPEELPPLERCQACGANAPTRYIAFYQNIGALVVRYPSWVQGKLCKSCIHKYFWKMTGTTFFLGWWGTASFILTPFILLNNIFRYLFRLFMPSAHAPMHRPD
jgi:hypothetical protein